MKREDMKTVKTSVRFGGVEGLLNNSEVDLSELLVQLGMLVVESRLPADSPKGREEGPHCLHVSGDRVEHICDLDQAICRRAEKIQDQIRAQYLNNIPICIEVLLFPNCAHGYKKAADTDVLSSSEYDDSYILLELWTIQTVPKIRTEACDTSKLLCQAMRSHLYYSQLSSWLASTHGVQPQNVGYRISSPTEFCPSSFAESPELKTFPLALGNKSVNVRVSLSTMPRVDRIPSPICHSRYHHHAKERSAALAQNITEEDLGFIPTDGIVRSKDAIDKTRMSVCPNNIDFSRPSRELNVTRGLVEESVLEMSLRSVRCRSLKSDKNSEVFLADCGQASGCLVLADGPMCQYDVNNICDLRCISPKQVGVALNKKLTSSRSRSTCFAVDLLTEATGASFTNSPRLDYVARKRNMDFTSSGYMARDGNVDLSYSDYCSIDGPSRGKYDITKSVHKVSVDGGGAVSKMSSVPLKRCTNYALSDISMNGKSQKKLVVREKENFDSDYCVAEETCRVQPRPLTKHNASLIVPKQRLFSSNIGIPCHKMPHEMELVLDAQLLSNCGRNANLTNDKHCQKERSSTGYMEKRVLVNNSSSRNKPNGLNKKDSNNEGNQFEGRNESIGLNQYEGRKEQNGLNRYESIAVNLEHRDGLGRDALKDMNHGDGLDMSCLSLSDHVYTDTTSTSPPKQVLSTAPVFTVLDNSHTTFTIDCENKLDCDNIVGVDHEYINVGGGSVMQICLPNETQFNSVATVELLPPTSIVNSTSQVEEVRPVGESSAKLLHRSNTSSTKRSFSASGSSLVDVLMKSIALNEAARSPGVIKSGLTSFPVPNQEERTRFNRNLRSSSNEVFNSGTRLPLQSSPIPVRRLPSGSFDFDISLGSQFKSSPSMLSLSSPVPRENEGPVTCSRGAAYDARVPPSPNCLLGTFEESLMNGRIAPAGVVDGFTVDVSASNDPCTTCTPHIKLPVTTFYFNISDDQAPSPYLGHISLKDHRHGCNIPREGKLTVMLFNPTGSVLNIFHVVYDFSDMPPNCRTFLRQRTLYVPVTGGGANTGGGGSTFLKYLIHLRFASSRSRKIYLHTDIRVIFAHHKCDVKSNESASYQLKTFTEGPTNPRYSPTK